MNVVATIVLKQGHTTDGVIQEFIGYFEKYLNSVTEVVSYLRISDLLFNCSGVEDVISYTLNGSNQSINLTDTQTAVIGEINVAI